MKSPSHQFWYKSLAILALVFLSSQLTIAQKKVAILGDSYSTFEKMVEPDTNYVWYFSEPKFDTDVTEVEQTWWYQFIKRNDYKLNINNSFSGSTICNTGYDGEDYSTRSFVARMTKLGDPDMILIFGATNDSWAGVPIGEYKYADWTKAELYSFRPAMARMLDFIIKKHPEAEVYFLLNNELKPEINESVKTICNHYQVDCVELKNIAKKAGHPSIKGMKQISDQLTSFINIKN